MAESESQRIDHNLRHYFQVFETEIIRKIYESEERIRRHIEESSSQKMEKIIEFISDVKLGQYQASRKFERQEDLIQKAIDELKQMKPTNTRISRFNSDMAPRKFQFDSVAAPMNLQFDNVSAPKKFQFDSVAAPMKFQMNSVAAPMNLQFDNVSPLKKFHFDNVAAPMKFEPESVTEPEKSQMDSATKPIKRQRLISPKRHQVPMSPIRRKMTQSSQNPASVIQDSASKIQDPVSKTKASKIRDSISKKQDSVSKVKDPASKKQDSVSKVKDSTSKKRDSESEVKDSAPKHPCRRFLVPDPRIHGVSNMSSSTANCIYCQYKHYADECPIINDPVKRKAFLSDKNRCLRCFGNLETNPHTNCSTKDCFYCKYKGEYRNDHHSSICQVPVNIRVLELS